MKAFRFFLKILSGIKREKGYTLTEMTAVVAVTATLTALALPVVADKIEKGKETRAAMDVRSIAQAINGFNQTNGEFPARNAAKAFNAIKFLTVGGGRNPDVATGTNWVLTGADVDDAKNHLFINGNDRYRPCGLSTTGEKIKRDCWAGPYMGDLKEDPWGNKYVVNIQAFYDESVASGYGYIASAGKNGVIDTKITDIERQLDDIVAMAFKARHEVEQ